MPRCALNAAILGTYGTIGGVLAYSHFVEARRPTVERTVIPIGGLKQSIRVALLADFHLGTAGSVSLTKRAIGLALRESPDVLVFAGDLLSQWRNGIEADALESLAPLKGFTGKKIAVTGNHDYKLGDGGWLDPVFAAVGVELLQNRSVCFGGANWVGIDSALSGRADVFEAFQQVDFGLPTIATWHEPDCVDYLPQQADMMLAGHSHGGQMLFPGGFAPMHTVWGRKYVSGFYPDAPVPLYVTRGVGTTLMPLRLLCPPEVTLIDLAPQE